MNEGRPADSVPAASPSEGPPGSEGSAGLVRYRKATLASAVLLVFIIWTGAAVRLSGSGLGCPNWPTCKDGQVVPARGSHAQIEFGNRVITGLCLLAATIAVLGAFRLRPVRRDLRRLAVIVVIGLFGNAVVGGMIVLLHLKPISVIAHFLLAIAVLTFGLILHFQSGRLVQWSRARPVARHGVVALGVMAGAAFALGTVVTASGPHGGDPDVERLAFSGRDVARLHSVADWLLLVLVIGIGVGAQHAGEREVVRRVSVTLGLAVAQGIVGYFQYFRGVPVGLVMVHVSLASLLWCSLVWMADGMVRVTSPVVLRDGSPLASRPRRVDAPAR